MAIEVKVKWDQNFPENLKNETLSAMSPYLHLLDRDIHTLTVMIKGASSDVEGEAAIQIRRHYHVAFVWLDALFFTLTEEEKERTILHEFTHVLIDGYSREVEHLVQHLPLGELKEYVEWRLEDAEERLTDYLSLVLYDALRTCKGCLPRPECVERGVDPYNHPSLKEGVEVDAEK